MAQKAFINVDFLKVLLAWKRKIILIVSVAAFSGIATFLITYFCIQPAYESTVQIYVNNSDITTSSSSVTSADLSAASQLVDLYRVLLNTDDTLDIVLENSGLDYSYAQLKNMISTSAIDDTQVFKVTVTSTSPEEAQLLAATIGDVLPSVITEIVQGADAMVVSHAKIPTDKSSPNYIKNTLIGMMAGMVLVLFAVAVAEVADTKIHGEDDISEVTQLPVLVNIPDFNSTTHFGYEYGGYYQKASSKRGG